MAVSTSAITARPAPFETDLDIGTRSYTPAALVLDTFDQPADPVVEDVLGGVGSRFTHRGRRSLCVLRVACNG